MAVTIIHYDTETGDLLSMDELTDVELKAFSVIAGNSESTREKWPHAPECYDWISNVIHDRARKAIDHLIMAYTDRRPEKLTLEQKADQVRQAVIKPAAELAAATSAELERRASSE